MNSQFCLYSRRCNAIPDINLQTVQQGVGLWLI